MSKGFFPVLTILLVSALSAPAASGAGEYERISTDSAVLDRNGDGFQDIIIQERKVHYDLDYDGRFDYTLGLKFAEYTSAGHKRYLASDCSTEVFAELTMEGLDELCATDRDEQRWFEKNFEEFSYYHDGYAFLYLFSDSPGNDGRLAAPRAKGDYAYYVTFNPDGSVRSVRRGDERVNVAEFDQKTKVSSGKKVLLPKIVTTEDLAQIRAEIDHLLK